MISIINEKFFDDICNRYVKKQTLVEIAKSYNVSRDTIKRILTYKNIKLRGHKIYEFNETYFDLINTEEKAYFLGLMYADGYLNDRMISAALTLKDLDILEKLKTATKYSGPIKKYNKKLKNKIFEIYEIKFINRYFIERCKKLGFVQKKSHILKFPTEEQVPNHLIRHFIRGYFDGDGSITFSKITNIGACNIIGSRFFCNELHKILSSRVRINIYKYFHKNGKTVYLSISGRFQNYKFLNYLYLDSKIHLNRKYSKYIEFKSSVKDLKKYNRNIKIKEVIDI